MYDFNLLFSLFIYTAIDYGSKHRTNKRCLSTVEPFQMYTSFSQKGGEAML